MSCPECIGKAAAFRIFMFVLVQENYALIPAFHQDFLLDMAVIDIHLHAAALRVFDLKFSSCLVFPEGLHDSGKDKPVLATAGETFVGSLIQLVFSNCGK